MPVDPVTAPRPAASGEAPGWFGKLATLGDFAHRRLPPEFIRVGDDWLSRAMVESRQQLGERWLDVYLTAPVMRFAWAPGVADTQWWFGLLMASCDNVGRYFPLLIAHRREQPPLDRIALNHLEAWYDHLAMAATQTLSDRSSIETFEAALVDSPPWPTPGQPMPLTAAPLPGGRYYSLRPRTRLDQWLDALAIDEVCSRFGGCSIWWHQGRGASASAATVVRGLPDPTAFAGMLAA
jgi:type VI secretion system protein ImpM